MRNTGVGTLVLIMIMVAACSSHGASADAAIDASTDAAVDAGVAAAADAATMIVNTPGGASSPMPCDAICAEHSWTCVPLCPSLGGGSTVAGNKVYMNMGSYKQLDIATCSEAVPPTYMEFGTTYQLDQFTCCCRAPAVQKIDGDPGMLESCDSLCAMHGLMCEPQTDFGFVGMGGIELVYDNSAGGQVFDVGTCSTVPTPMGSGAPAGETWTLNHFTCGCR